MIYLMLADGFEEIEALTPLDILRRAGIEIKTVGVTGKTVTGAHSIPVVADILIEDIVLEDMSAVILPGGMPGTLNLKNEKQVEKALLYAAEKGLLIAAICAAPLILGNLGLLKGKEAICFPGFEDELRGAEISPQSVVKSGNIITAKGAGVAAEFGFEILKHLKDSVTAEKLRISMMYR